jgi:hypothetical protein
MHISNKSESLANRYKNIILRTKNLILFPKKEWEIIFNEKGDFNKVISEFSLPYIGIITLISFISSLMSHHQLDFSLALRTAVAQFASFFLGLLICYFIAVKTIPQFVKKVASKDVKLLAIQLSAYSSIIIYLIKITISLIPQLYFIQITALFTGYLVWLGSKQLGDYENNDLRIVLTIIVSLLLLLLPYMISVIIIRFSGI